MHTFPWDWKALGQEGFLPTDDAPSFSLGQPFPSDHQVRFQHFSLIKPLLPPPSIIFIRQVSSSGWALSSSQSLHLSCYLWIEKCNRTKWFALNSWSPASNGHSKLPSRSFILLLLTYFPIPWEDYLIPSFLSWNLLHYFLYSQMMTSHFMGKIEKSSSLRQTCNLHGAHFLLLYSG